MLAARARRATLVGVGSCPMEGHCTSEKPLSFSARLCTAGPTAAPTPSKRRISHGAGATALSLPREEVQHSRLRRASAAPRCLESVCTLRKVTAPAKSHSPLVHGRVLTCWPRPTTPSKRHDSCDAGATALSLSLGKRRSTRTCGARTPRCAGWSRTMPLGRKLHHREALSFEARPCSDVSNVTSNTKQATPRLAWRRRHCALSLSREKAQHAHLLCALAAPRRLESVHVF